MTDYRPLYFTLALLLIIGVVLPMIVSDFVNVSEVETDSILDPLITIIDEGVGIFGFNLNIFGFLGDTLQGSLVDYLTIFALIPENILIPLLLIMITGIVYTIVKLLPTT